MAVLNGEDITDKVKGILYFRLNPKHRYINRLRLKIAKYFGIIPKSKNLPEMYFRLVLPSDNTKRRIYYPLDLVKFVGEIVQKYPCVFRDTIQAKDNKK